MLTGFILPIGDPLIGPASSIRCLVSHSLGFVDEGRYLPTHRDKQFSVFPLSSFAVFWSELYTKLTLLEQGG